MIDSLVHCRELLHQMPLNGAIAAMNGAPYFLATVHRPSNVDDPSNLSQVVEILESASHIAPLFFVTHPRTRDRLQRIPTGNRMITVNDGMPTIQRGCIYLLPPLPYREFLRVMSGCKAVLTDSGGIQEETTFLKIPCLTMRHNTERPVTVELGTNRIVGLDHEKIFSHLEGVMQGSRQDAPTPPLWDGRAAERVVDVLKSISF